MARNLKYQLLTCINNSFVPGTSKHSLKKQKLTNSNKIFSYNDRKNLINLSSSFSSFMKEKFPDVKLAKNIKNEHINQFLVEKSRTCSTETLNLYRSNFKKLGKTVEAYYHCEVNWKPNNYSGYKDSIRNIQMDFKDYNTLLSSYKKGSTGYNALYFCYSFGCRREELSKLKAKDLIISNNKATLKIIDGKGKKSRVVTCSHSNLSYFEEIKSKMGENERIIPINKESITKNVRLHLKQTNLSEKYDKTCIHSIRKLFAQTSYNNFRENMSKKDALNLVSKNLGHGENRLNLMQRYVQEIW